MSDLGIVPVGFNDALKAIHSTSGDLPSGPVSFTSSPQFEFYKDPDTGTVGELSGLGLLASKILYLLFTPMGSYAMDTTKGSYLEDLVGSNFDKASVTVNLVRSIQKVEADLKDSSYGQAFSRKLDETLDSIKVVNIKFNTPDAVTVSLVIKAQSGKTASLQVEV